MNRMRERYLVDEQGKRVAVVLSIEDYRCLLEELEEQDAVRAFDEAVASDDDQVPLEQVVAEFESGP